MDGFLLMVRQIKLNSALNILKAGKLSDLTKKKEVIMGFNLCKQPDI